MLSRYSTPLDARGNKTTAPDGSTLAFNAAQQPTSAGFGHDNAGSQTASPGVTRDLDIFKQIRVWTGTNAGPTATLTSGFLADGRRAYKDSGGGGAGKHWFIYDGDTVIQEVYIHTASGNRADVYAAYIEGPSGMVEFWRKNQNRPTARFYDIFANPTNRLQYTPGNAPDKTHSWRLFNIL